MYEEFSSLELANKVDLRVEVIDSQEAETQGNTRLWPIGEAANS